MPLDGKVIEGTSMVDTSALTGESVPREVEVGNDVLSGFVNQNGVLTIEVTKEFGESTVSKILDLVQNASSKKHQRKTLLRSLHVTTLSCSYYSGDHGVYSTTYFRRSYIL